MADERKDVLEVRRLITESEAACDHQNAYVDSLRETGEFFKLIEAREVQTILNESLAFHRESLVRLLGKV